MHRLRAWGSERPASAAPALSPAEGPRDSRRSTV